MKIPKKDVLEHCATKAASHKAEVDYHKAKTDQKMGHANLHKAEAERYSVSDPAQAQFHRNKATLYKAEAAGHQGEATKHANVQEHYETLRDRFAASPDDTVDVGADVMDEHSDASRNLQSVAGHDSFLRRIGLSD